MARLDPGKRAASTLLEAVIALAILGALAAIVVQCLVWSARDRALQTRHQAALELAANVLETARAQPWEKLDQSWADAQAIPADAASLLPDGKVVVSVEATQSVPQTRRVTVEVRWQSIPGHPPQSLRLTSLLSGRMAKKTGGK